MRQLFICALMGALIINTINVAQAEPTTRLPPAPSPSEFTHSAKVKTNTVHADKKKHKQKAELVTKKKHKRKISGAFKK